MYVRIIVLYGENLRTCLSGNKVNTNYERVALCDSVWLRNLDP